MATYGDQVDIAILIEICRREVLFLDIGEAHARVSENVGGTDRLPFEPDGSLPQGHSTDQQRHTDHRGHRHESQDNSHPGTPMHTDRSPDLRYSG